MEPTLQRDRRLMSGTLVWKYACSTKSSRAAWRFGSRRDFSSSPGAAEPGGASPFAAPAAPRSAAEPRSAEAAEAGGFKGSPNFGIVSLGVSDSHTTRSALGLSLLFFARFLLGGDRVVQSFPEQLARLELHYLARAEGDLVAGLRIPSGPCVLALYFEDAEAGDHHLAVAFEAELDELDPILDDLRGLMLVKRH